MPRRFLQILLLYLLLFVICGAHWFVRKFGQVEPEQLLYHLQEAPAAMVWSNHALARNFIVNVVLAPAIGPALVMLVMRLAPSAWRMRMGARMTAAGRAVSHPALLATCVALAAGWASTRVLAWPSTDVVGGKDWIAASYRWPAKVAPPAQRRNLVLIYAESMEADYAPPRLADGLLQPLASLQGAAVPHFRQAHGTGWTMAGIVATQCGLPLKPLGIFGHNDLGQVSDAFLPGARCLGDVLKANGWTNVFLGGAAGEFAGKANFFRTHGYDRVVGRADWLRADPDVLLTDWGVHDDYLLLQALAELARLQRAGQPFNLTLLTHAAHPPHGFPSPSCPRPNHDMQDAVLCTSLLLRNFVETAERAGLLRDTQLVITGDHLLQQSELSDRLGPLSQRSIFNRFVPAPRAGIHAEEIDHFDLFPSLLAVLGFELADGQLALGCSAIGDAPCSSLATDPQLDAKLRAHSAFYDELWLSPP
ncbi:hypothetical protein GCM10027034_07860 [Ramlibacter solisilvae]|uniref:sulfatase-like hydrolase/transferase n=1 Tax=Ramlibacter tataouinensis TaxID=94132 RepID=UPI000777892C|nr:sulfatase-like hydrolase/transferase [Ramlibacter tataouinensis]